MSSLNPWIPVSAVRNSWLTIDRNSVFVRSSFSNVALALRCDSSASPSLSCASRTMVTSSTITSTCSGRPLESGIDVAVSWSHSHLPPPVPARTWTLWPSVMPASSGANRDRDGRLVVSAKQVRPRVRAHGLEVVLGHLEQGGVGLQQLTLAADAGDPDRGALEDRPVVGLAAAQRLGGLRAADELADLAAGGRQHRDQVVLDPARLADSISITPVTTPLLRTGNAIADRSCARSASGARS